MKPSLKTKKKSSIPPAKTAAVCFCPDEEKLKRALQNSSLEKHSKKRCRSRVSFFKLVAVFPAAVRLHVVQSLVCSAGRCPSALSPALCTLHHIVPFCFVFVKHKYVQRFAEIKRPGMMCRRQRPVDDETAEPFSRSVWQGSLTH